ncbi:MAG: CHAT domain-containing protein, partial [Caldilineaceae bacterium]|nr:CHAT domain-containing protein [Caldilineaceae bacterium]
RAIGKQLFAALIVGGVRDAYSSSLLRAREQEAGLRLRLRIDEQAPEIATLPWEFLYDLQEGDHVCLLRETPLTRYIPLHRDRDLLSVKPPLRILGMVSSPADLVHLNVAEEQARIEHALEYRLERGEVMLQWVAGNSWQALQAALDQGPWHVFHFIGHGNFDPLTCEGQLVFCDDQGAPQQMSATMLGRLFSGHSTLRLAFLNACEGGRNSDAELFSSVGAVLTRRGIAAVISMQFDISDNAALEFARLFYDALARGRPVDVAVTTARMGLSFADPQGVEWATPMLHMRAPDGCLFTVDAGAAVFDEEKPVPRPTIQKAVPPPVPDAGQSSTRGLNILRRKVEQFWIDGVLGKSVFQQMLYELGVQSMSDAVASPWSTQIDQLGAPSQSLATGQTLADLFDEYGGLLLILGEPGAGKTTAMLTLTRSLLQHIEIGAGDNIQQPVPVVFNLSSWSPDFSLLEDWLAREMSRQYQIPQVEGRKLLAAGQLLPMLDGLDETSADLRTRCIEAINGYVLERNLTGLLVCCRLKEYVACPVRLALNTAIRLTELGDEQVDDYLAALGGQVAGLRDLLRRETAMRFDARSPLWLNLMVRAYQGLSAVDLARESEHNAAARRRHLLDAYMAHMFRRARGEE